MKKWNHTVFVYFASLDRIPRIPPSHSLRKYLTFMLLSRRITLVSDTFISKSISEASGTAARISWLCIDEQLKSVTHVREDVVFFWQVLHFPDINWEINEHSTRRYLQRLGKSWNCLENKVIKRKYYSCRISRYPAWGCSKNPSNILF